MSSTTTGPGNPYIARDVELDIERATVPGEVILTEGGDLTITIHGHNVPAGVLAGPPDPQYRDEITGTDVNGNAVVLKDVVMMPVGPSGTAEVTWDITEAVFTRGESTVLYETDETIIDHDVTCFRTTIPQIDQKFDWCITSRCWRLRT